MSPASIIRRPIFHYGLITRNSDCSTRDLHGELYYDLPAFVEDADLVDSMQIVQRYSLEPFMTPTPVFLPSGGHGVLPHYDIQARAQSDCYSFFYRWPTKDTTGHRYCIYVQSASGPRQLSQLQTVAPSLYPKT